jgi:surface polysaccharide O-acyltransferase-like enzyme
MNLPPSRVITLAVVALASIALGFTGAKTLANEQYGYVAGYTWFALMLVGVPLVLLLLVTGLILYLSARTRWAGLVSIAAAILIVVSAFTSFKILDVMGRVRYKHEEMIPLIPETAELVVFLKTGATHEQVQSFWQETLSTKQGTGSWPRDGIRDIGNHAPVDGHEVIVVGFFPDATDAQRSNVKSLISDSPLVYKFFENVRYVEIDHLLEKKPSAKATSNKSLDASGGSVFHIMTGPAMLE